MTTLLTDYPTKPTKRKIQRAVRNIKSKLSKDEYNKIHPIVSPPGKLYGTAKVNKIAGNDSIGNFPLRPINSNIGLACYHLAKRLKSFSHPSVNRSLLRKMQKLLYKKLKTCCHQLITN